MVIASFLVKDKEERSCFFEKTFLLANISINIALCIPFFILSNVEIYNVDFYIYWKIYTVAKVFPTIRQVKLIRKREFVTATLDLEHQVFIVYIASIS